LGSFARHRATAGAVRLDCQILELPGLAMDIDEPRDLGDLMERKRGDPRYAFLWNDEGGARLELTADTDQA
jgi:2-phospho-L-lactate guanylyltransferase (CobY/MobA/RfbA family)